MSMEYTIDGAGTQPDSPHLINCTIVGDVSTGWALYDGTKKLATAGPGALPSFTLTDYHKKDWTVTATSPMGPGFTITGGQWNDKHHPQPGEKPMPGGPPPPEADSWTATGSGMIRRKDKAEAQAASAK
jgi:hypothetical protein